MFPLNRTRVCARTNASTFLLTWGHKMAEEQNKLTPETAGSGLLLGVEPLEGTHSRYAQSRPRTGDIGTDTDRGDADAGDDTTDKGDTDKGDTDTDRGDSDGGDDTTD